MILTTACANMAYHPEVARFVQLGNTAPDQKIMNVEVARFMICHMGSNRASRRSQIERLWRQSFAVKNIMVSPGVRFPE